MSLDVVLVRPGEKRWMEVVAQLDWDGYYLFLQKYWPASSSTGKVIDLYDTAVFRGANLEQLRGCLERARQAAADLPSTWTAFLGEQVVPERKKLYSRVERARLEHLVDRLASAVIRAQAESLEVHFEGD